MLERVLVFETGHRADVARALRAERTKAAMGEADDEALADSLVGDVCEAVAGAA